MRCRVVTWNIHSCVGTDGRHEPGRIADVLAELDADVIGLQEVDWRHEPRNGMDPFEFIASRLGMTPIAGPNLRDHRGEYGNGLLTRWNVIGTDRIDLAAPGREPRGAIDAAIESGAFTMRALVTHLGLDRRERRQQIRTLRDAVLGDAASDAVVLMGDLNVWAPRRLIRTSLMPVPFPAGATGRTFPSRCPMLRLDHVLVRPQPRALDSRVIRTTAARRASDHLPVVANVDWPE